MNSAEEFYHLEPSFYNFSSNNVSNFVSWHSHDERSIGINFHLFCCTDRHFKLNTIYLVDCRKHNLGAEHMREK